MSVEALDVRYWNEVGMLLAEKTRFQRSGCLGARGDVGLAEGAGEGGARVKVREKLTVIVERDVWGGGGGY